MSPLRDKDAAEEKALSIRQTRRPLGGDRGRMVGSRKKNCHV